MRRSVGDTPSTNTDAFGVLQLLICVGIGGIPRVTRYRSSGQVQKDTMARLCRRNFDAKGGKGERGEQEVVISPAAAMK